MKIKEGYMVSTVAGSSIVVPMGENTVNFNGVMTLNETGCFLWRLLEKGAQREELIRAMTDEYEVDEQTAAADIDVFLKKLEDNGLAE